MQDEERAIIAGDFANRLRKNLKKFRRWADREGLEAYRIYDADLPEYAAAIDLYGGYALVQEYQAPKSISEKTAHQRMLNLLAAVVQVLEIPGENVILKVRERKKGDSQYEKLDETKRTLLVREYGISFIAESNEDGLCFKKRPQRRELNSFNI